MLKCIKKTTEKHNEYPLIIVGDFNSLPDSSVYRYIRDGNLKQNDIPDPLQTINFSHPFKFESAYDKIGEPKSNITVQFSGCLDYIWFDRTSFELVSLLESLQPQDYAEFKALPNPYQPSDHTSLLAKLSFVPKQ